MNNIIKIGLLLLMVTIFFSACDKDWTTPKANDVEGVINKSDKELKEIYQIYLENLRTYKETKHPIAFERANHDRFFVQYP